MIELILLDEVNCMLRGLPFSHISHIIEQTKLPVPGAFTTAAFKLKQWDGKESQFGEDGVFFQFMIPQVLDILEHELHYNIDSIYLIDERMKHSFDIPLVDDQFLIKETGKTLREHQVNGINAAITEQKGIIDFATNAGKVFICIGISKAFDPYLPSIVVVPSEHLLHQTFKDYEKTDLDVFAMTKNVKPAKRQEKFDTHRHIIITSKLLLNCVDYLHDVPRVLIVDETHQCGEMFMGALRTAMSECPVRIGMTGTVPKDKLKRHKVMCHLGGDVLDTVTAKYLIDNQFASTATIDTIRTSDSDMETTSEDKEVWTWEVEKKYLENHKPRAEAIADYIISLPTKNTLVICNPSLGSKMASYSNTNMIIDETPTETRQEWFSEFDDKDDVLLFGSFGCASTGISVDRIKRLIIVDVGKNETYIKQSIGRGLRLDGEENELEVIDISAKTRYSDRHYKERTKLYKREGYCYTESSNYIPV